MTFEELHKLFEKELGVNRLADIARELGVSPQVVSNWKNRNIVPYKYVKKAKDKVRNSKFEENNESINAPKIFLAKADSVNVDEASHTDILKLLFSSIKNNYKIVIYTLSLILFCAGVNLFILSKPVYISKATILPNQDAGASSSISSIMDQFGLGGVAPTPNDISSAKLFPDILKSKTLSHNLLKKTFNTESYGDSVSLLDILINDNSINDNVRTEMAVIKLKNKISIKQGYNSPLITISASSPEPKLARDITDAILIELTNLQKKFKLQKINEKRLFISDRIKIVDDELNKSEKNLKKFREQNRNITGSPALLLEEDRLKRDVQVQLQIYITLKRELELAQIEEVEQSTALTILDPPEIPVFRSSPQKRRGMTIALIFGISLGVVIAILKENWLKLKNLYMELD